jgi:hypothetical protein
MISPPAIPGIIFPRTVAAAKHVAAHDRRPDVLKVFRRNVVVWTRRAAFHAMDRAENPRGKRPFVELFAPFAERIGNALVRAGDVTVERHRDIEPEFCHRSRWRLSSVVLMASLR